MSAIVLTPILKNSPSGKMTDPSVRSQRVTFSLPIENVDSVIKYIQEESPDESYQTKFNKTLKSVLSPDTEDATLMKWLQDFKDNIFFLDKENERLTSALLRMNWVDRSEKLITLYLELILNLVSAHPFYLRPVLFMSLRLFYPENEESESISAEEMAKFQKVHVLLKHVVELVPSSPELLCDLLSDKFPYKKRPAHVFHCYLQNTLMACTYLPSKRIILLECILGKILHIDLFCSKDVIERFEQERQCEEQESIFLMEQSSEVDTAPKFRTDQMAYPLAHSLDVQMNCLFNFIHRTCFPDGVELNWEATKKLYKEILTISDRIFLPTHGSCHVQFVMFYLCSLRKELLEGFLDYLWKKVQNPSIAPIVRQIASFYIGSMLSRANYVSISTAAACIELMCNWIHRYIDTQDAGNSRDIAVHGSFHSVCQSVFYTFAFRHKEFVEMKHGHKYLRGLNFDRVVTCRFNPLKFCERAIVQNFASVARNYQIAYCYPVIEKNNRSLSSFYLESTMAEPPSGAIVQMFFPFDPYVLKQSKHWIEPLYRIYEPQNNLDESMDEDIVHDIETSPSNNPLFCYGASPGFRKSDNVKFSKLR